jgi:tetratricopeptide (TPR) repeat protein
MSRVLCLFCCILIAIGCGATSAFAIVQKKKDTVPSAKKAHPVESWLKRGHRLTRRYSRLSHLAGARLLLKAWKVRPRQFKTLLAASKACHFFAKHAKQKKKIVYWGQRGFKYASLMRKRYPRRAEGYFWSAVNAGHHARGGGVWAAVTKGLAGKIERNARRSMKLNPKLYGGNAQKILGRFYYRLPWPMRRLKKSEKFLLQTYKLSPKDPTILFYLGETFWARSKKQKARRFFKKCAALYHPTMHAKASPRLCRRWLKLHR